MSPRPKQKAGLPRAGVSAADTVIVPRLLTVREVAGHLGLQEGTIYGWIAARRLPVVRLRRSVRIPADSVAELIASNTVPPAGGAR